jgi:hypothetical protein
MFGDKESMHTTQQVLWRHSLAFLQMIWWFKTRQIPLRIKTAVWGAGLTFTQLTAQHYTDVALKVRSNN